MDDCNTEYRPFFIQITVSPPKKLANTEYGHIVHPPPLWAKILNNVVLCVNDLFLLCEKWWISTLLQDQGPMKDISAYASPLTPLKSKFFWFLVFSQTYPLMIPLQILVCWYTWLHGTPEEAIIAFELLSQYHHWESDSSSTCHPICRCGLKWNSLIGC